MNTRNPKKKKSKELKMTIQPNDSNHFGLDLAKDESKTIQITVTTTRRTDGVWNCQTLPHFPYNTINRIFKAMSIYSKRSLRDFLASVKINKRGGEVIYG